LNLLVLNFKQLGIQWMTLRESETKHCLLIV